MINRIKQALDTILEAFKDGIVPATIALMQYPVFDVPMNKWSFLNQLICYLNGSSDFRGYLQWKDVNRFVKKGSKGVFILVPWIKKEKDENDEENQKLIGFLGKPVFAYENTDGEELEYKKLSLPDFPLIEKARSLGLNVTVISGNKEFLGYYRHSDKVIALASPEECVFAHELIHAVDYRLHPEMKPSGQDPIKEVVAELGATALCQIVGKDGTKFLGNSYRYIDSYAKDLKVDAHTACLKVLNRVEKILKFILETEVKSVFTDN